MPLDLENSYAKAKSQIDSVNSYRDLKSQYEKQSKRAGQAFEQASSAVLTSIDQAKEQTKRFQKQIKNQLDQLLDINNITGGKGAGSIALIKNLFLQTIKNIEPEIARIIEQEAINILGCDQQQSYSGDTDYYIKVSSIDLYGLLKKDPNSETGRLLYEKNPIQAQLPKFALNRELYKRIQNPNVLFSTDYSNSYRGQSGQDLFDIAYTEQNADGITGDWFRVTLKNRDGGSNKIIPFLVDYYKSIKLSDFPNIIAGIMEALTGCISISGGIGLAETEDQTKFNIYMQRILGLCFDNVREIDVTGTAKLAELDGIDDTFFEFTEIDLRNIEQRVNNIRDGVVQYEDCDNVSLPVNSQAIINSLATLFSGSEETIITRANNITDVLTDDEKWKSLTLSANIKASVDLNFVKLMVQGILRAILTPKLLLPIFVMLNVLGETLQNEINNLVAFTKTFKKFAINVISKISAIFVRELFELIRKNLKEILQKVVLDLQKEKADKRIIIILKLVQLLIVVAEFISDWRRCKSVVDELLWLLKIFFGNSTLNLIPGYQTLISQIPYPLLLAARFLDGYSETRAFIGTIEELQKLGIPTGPMPDGSPNLGVLAMFSQMKAMAREDAENGKVEIAMDPVSFTPAGFTNGIVLHGKKI